MTGPALVQRSAHHAIHDAAWLEAEEITERLQACLDHRDPRQFADVAKVLLEHWETRTLRHAEAEEEGLYRDLAEQRPDLASRIVQLSRDHELLRRCVSRIREMLNTPGHERQVCAAFQALLMLSAWHNEDEERWLFAD